MINLRPTRPTKGQLKCFRCRENCLAKNGNWHEMQNRQVFLCKVCEHATQASPEKTPKHIG